MVYLQDAFTDLYDIFFSYDLNIMHVWESVDLRVYSAKKNMVTQYQPRAMTFFLA